MQQVSFSDISSMKGNGSSMRTVLKNFIDKGASVYLVHEDIAEKTERYFLVKYEELEIPLRAYDLNFYSVFNSHLARSITSNKLNSGSLLAAWQVPVPDTMDYSADSDVESFLKQHTTLVVKPRSGAHGEGITTGITDLERLQSAIKTAQAVEDKILIQQQIDGHDHRLLFMDYKFVAAVKRVPAAATGDGKQTVRQLVEASNAKIEQLWQDIRAGVEGADAQRGSISKTPIDEIINARGEAILRSVPAAGETVQLVDKANVSLGGQTHDVTNDVNAEFATLISSVLKKINLPLCGVDVLSTDISSPPEAQKSFIIELNAAPGLRLHELPSEGEPRHVCLMIAESLIKYYRSLNGSL